MATTSESVKTEGGVATTSAILKALITGLDPGILDTNLTSSGNTTQDLNSVATTLKDLIDYTTNALTTETIQAVTTKAAVTTIAPTVTSQDRGDVMGGLDDLYTVVMTTQSPGFVLTPMYKWFIATGTIIFLVIILIFINGYISYYQEIHQAVKDVKHYAAEEKRVRREQNMIDKEEDRNNTRQTHVFWTLLAAKKKRKEESSKYKL